MIQSGLENRLLMTRENIYQLTNQLGAMEKRSFRSFSKTADQFQLEARKNDDFKILKSLENEVKSGIRFYHVSNRPILSFLIVAGVSSWMIYTVGG